MKADQINRFMRVNGRKNLWLLRNTNQLYENAVKTYYDRNTSLLPYDPASQNVKSRKENRAPVRALTMRETAPASDYPRNHNQMAEQAAGATSGQLLNTVMQANRRRSMSFTAGGLRMCGEHMINASDSGCGRRRGGSSSDDSSTAIGGSRRRAHTLDLSGLNGRSMSLPPRTTLELGMGYALGKGKGPPSCKQHLIAIEKSSNARAVSLASRQCQRAEYDCDSDQLMVVDEALKQRLAMRFDRQPEDETSAARFRLGFGSAGLIDRRQLPRVPKSYNMRSEPAPPHSVNKEQTRFQTLGERIRQFKVIQFADGPVTFQAFNRRSGYAGGRIHNYDNRHLPKQEPCLSFHNVLHTNHRQRSLNYQTRSQSLETNPRPVSTPKKGPPVNVKPKAPPLEPLGPLAPNWRPQQQQQQHHPQNYEALTRLAAVAPPILPLSLAGIHKAKLKRFRTPVNITKSRSKRSVHQASSSRSLQLASSKNKTRVKDNYTDKEKTKESQQELLKAQEQEKASDDAKSETRVQAMMQSIAKANPDLTQTNISNNISRTSHLFYMKENARRHDLPAPRMAEQLQAVKKTKVTRKEQVELPKQPQSAKGAHHLLAASASQVSAFKRAFKNRQQIMQAEMLHIHAQHLPDNQHLVQQQQQRHRLQQLQHKQQQQRLALQQPLSKPQSFFPAVTTKYTTSQLQGAGEPRPLAKQPPKMQATKTTVQQQHEAHQQQLLKHAAAKQKTRQEPAAKQSAATQSKLPLPQLPRANHQPTTGSAVPVEATTKQRGIAAPCLAYTFKPAGQASANTQSPTSSYQRQQQQQLHHQLRQRRQQPFESLWRNT